MFVLVETLFSPIVRSSLEDVSALSCRLEPCGLVVPQHRSGASLPGKTASGESIYQSSAQNKQVILYCVVLIWLDCVYFVNEPLLDD